MTVIAAGFDGGMPKRRDDEPVLPPDAGPAADARSETRAAAQALAASRQAEAAGCRRRQPRAGPAPQPGRSPPQAPARPRPMQFDDDDLDVPDFLK